ncbi:lyase family protein [Flavimaricola marinus]|uniref:3-carboxy-cis,cis-muconate cycloisomerase n=1 Tax=Flavimaricola marinus TaxID=1819565 RepID=A0A238LHK1_9RHOB|nr:lyase family protein [Flavimaricola marinus]SMY08436.1 3-carboxy-cis,cis-muconate cycloisomerase [Flavimaricola marinus]
MSASLYDSAIFRDLMQDRETAMLFTDTAELRAMLLVWGALAQAQAKAGIVPDVSAKAIQRAAMEIQIDPAALASATGKNAVPVPALLASFRGEMTAPEHAAWVHYGATSQDIMDTGLALRLRQVLSLAEKRLVGIVTALGKLAEAEAETIMAGRTYGQVATPTTFGAMVASWGWPLLTLLKQLPAQRDAVLRVSLSGAAGTLSVMGDAGPQVRADLAAGLGLNDPGHSWHSDRSGIAGLSAWITQVTGALGKIGADLALMAQSGISEARSGAAGGSSTMPQKQNPVGPTVLMAIAAQIVGLNSVMQSAQVHRQQRDGAAWISEWLSFPQICLGLGRSLALAEELINSTVADPAQMRANLDDGRGLIFAEALSFRLSETLPRPDAQAAVKSLCATCLSDGTPLPDLARAAYPDLSLDDVFDMGAQLGLAPSEARAFAATAAELAN